MQEDIFAQPNEAEDLFPPASQPENDNPEEEAPSQEGAEEATDDQPEADNTPDEVNVPFHEHPRWIEREEDWKKKLERVEQNFQEQLEKRVQPIQEKVQSVDQFNQPQLNEKLVPFIGDDPKLHKQWSEMMEDEKKTLAQQVREEIENEKLSEKQELDKWNNWFDNEVERLRSSGKEFDKNELFKTAVEYKPTDETGTISLEKAYDILSMQKSRETPKTEARRKVAGVMSQASKGTPTQSSVVTSKDVRNRSWYDS